MELPDESGGEDPAGAGEAKDLPSRRDGVTVKFQDDNGQLQWLHATRLGFEHPDTGEQVEYESPYPDDLARSLEVIRDSY